MGQTEYAPLVAFPTCLNAAVTRLLPLLEPPCETPPLEWFSLSCEGETLIIPHRVYGSPPSEATFKNLEPLEQTIVACWFSRHHDGHVRERFLGSIKAFERRWVISYVVALCGEYVVEILDHVWRRRDLFDRITLGNWLRENPLFYAQRRSRIVSYWNCGYRWSSPRFTDYIGSQLLTFFDACLCDATSGGH